MFRKSYGCLLYFCFTRLNPIHVTQTLCQFMSLPSTDHFVVAIYVLRYLKDTILLNLFYPIDVLILSYRC